MFWNQLIVMCFVLGLVSNVRVEGLQCYVCEDCNEYEDFKELHICGEIGGTTVKPMTLPEFIENNEAPPTTTTLKPTLKPVGDETEEYVDFYSEETNDENSNSSQNNSGEPKPTTRTRTATTTIETPTTSEQSQSKIPEENSTATNGSTEKFAETTTESVSDPATAVKQEEVISNSPSSPTSSPSTSNIETVTSTVTTPIISGPIQLTDDDDYMEYDIPNFDDRSQAGKMSKSSLLKVNEPVCYMIKLHVNNTIITNRGCTTFINANKYSTCQSLYNGAPMGKCLVCSDDGCNKFLSDYSYEDDSGLPISASGVMDKFGIYVLIVLITTYLILV